MQHFREGLVGLKSITRPARVLNVMTTSHLPGGGGPSLACCQIRVDGYRATVLTQAQVMKAENLPRAGARMGTLVYIYIYIYVCVCVSWTDKAASLPPAACTPPPFLDFRM